MRVKQLGRDYFNDNHFRRNTISGESVVTVICASAATFSTTPYLDCFLTSPCYIGYIYIRQKSETLVSFAHSGYTSVTMSSHFSTAVGSLYVILLQQRLDTLSSGCGQDWHRMRMASSTRSSAHAFVSMSLMSCMLHSRIKMLRLLRLRWSFSSTSVWRFPSYNNNNNNNRCTK